MNQELTFKIAVYEYTTGPLAGLRTVYKYDYERLYEDRVRISEVEEITFKQRDTSEIMPEIIKSIDDRIEELKNEFLNQKLKLENKKAELLSLTSDGG